MPADHKVRVAWQIVFTFLPIVNLWAFYRIRKLRKYLLFVFVPSIVLIGYVSYIGAWFSVPTEVWHLFTPLSMISWGLQGFAIYLVIIWSRLHNRRVDASTGQAQQ